MLSTIKQISNFNHSDGNTVQYIVLHDTGCPTTDTAKNNADYFGGGDRQASAHYFVDDNSIYQVVEESQASWHCGDGGNAYSIGNHNSIGIEMCKTNGIITDATINNTIDLVKSLMSKYKLGIDKVVRHYDASHKICPGYMSANSWAKWFEFKNKISNTSTNYSKEPYPNRLIKVSPTYDYYALMIQKKLGIGADGYFGDLTKQAVINFQKKNGLDADGIVGQITWNKLFN